MNFYGYFNNREGTHYGIEISTPTGAEEVDLTLSDSPAILKTSSRGLFSPIKSRSLTVEIVSKDYYFDLYEPTSRGTHVKLFEFEYQDGYEGDVNHINIIRNYFFGYLKPVSYSQDFTYLDKIQLEAVDAVSTCKDFKWDNNGKYNSLLDIILSILKSAGYRGDLYIPNDYTHINTNPITETVADKLFVSSTNFLDDNEERTPWTQYEVLEEICNFMCWSLVPDGDDVWLIDYRAENLGSVRYYKYKIQSSEPNGYYDSPASLTDITVDNMAPGKSKIDIDDIYNKIEVSDNLYKIDEISPDIFDDDTHISITEEKKLGLSNSKWSTVRRKKFLWWAWDDNKDYLEGTDYQTFCRLKPESGWVHKYYNMSDGSYIGSSDNPLYEKGYYSESTNNNPKQKAWVSGANSNKPEQKVIKNINTHCCLIQHYAYVDESHPNNVPTTIDWSDILTFFIMGPTMESIPLAQIHTMEHPVLEYTIPEIIQWKPSTGKSWITLKGSLFYQFRCKYKDGKKNKVLTIINSGEGWYATAPIDKSMSNVPKDIKVGGNDCVRPESDPNYGNGFNIWKMKLQIGTKFWNGTNWEEYNNPSDPDNNNAPTFYLPYNNNPDNKSDEYIPAFKWIDVASNTTYKDQVGKDCYAIPIDSEKSSDPSFGSLKLTIYSPLMFPLELIDKLTQYFPNELVSFGTGCIPVIYCKDFELGYIYTDTSVWWNNHDDSNTTDKVYIGYIDDDYVQDFDGITCKINTSIKDKPISRSYVSTNNGYLASLKHKAGDTEKEQEYNIVDLYLDHHSDRKVIYNRNMKGYFKPYQKFSKPGNNEGEGKLDGTFMIDTQSFDFVENNNKIKFIAF